MCVLPCAASTNLRDYGDVKPDL